MTAATALTTPACGAPRRVPRGRETTAAKTAASKAMSSVSPRIVLDLNHFKKDGKLHA